MSGVVDEQVFAYLRYVHGLFNLTVLVLFFYSGF